MLRLVTLASLLVALGNASLFCPHTKMPSDLDSFQTMRIQVKKSVGQEPMYRIANTADTDKSFAVSSPRFRLLTRTDNVECPSKGCITELSAAQPKAQSSVLYLTNIIGKMIPPGFHHVESATRLYCAIVAGDCGANVPIYRYYKFLPSGLYHAYSTDEDIDIEGFAREPSPLCYGWHTLSSELLRAEGREGSGEDYSSEEEDEAVEVTDEERQEARKEEFRMVAEVCDDRTPPKPSSMKPLNVYVNDKTGALKDHYYTTKEVSEEDQKDSESEFYGYTLDKVGSLGKVVVDEEKSKCGCLLRLSQMLDEQTDMIPRKDHKLAVDFKEPPPSGGSKYTTLEEEVFCVREQGACGANVALRKYFHILELDTLYTVNTTDVPALTVPTPPGVLCYIWPNEKPSKKDPLKEIVAKKHKTTTTTETPTKKPTTTSVPKTTVKVTKKPSPSKSTSPAALKTQPPSTTERPKTTVTLSTIETTSTSKTTKSPTTRAETSTIVSSPSEAPKSTVTETPSTSNPTTTAPTTTISSSSTPKPSEVEAETSKATTEKSTTKESKQSDKLEKTTEAPKVLETPENSTKKE